jgi:hypothetical protein
MEPERSRKIVGRFVGAIAPLARVVTVLAPPLIGPRARSDQRIRSADQISGSDQRIRSAD